MIQNVSAWSKLRHSIYVQTGEGMICNPPRSNIGKVYPLQLSLRLCIVWAFIQFSANCSRPIRPICFCVGLTIKHLYIYYVGLFNVFTICIMILKLIVVILWFLLIYFRPTDLHCDCEFAIMSIILKIKIHKLKDKLTYTCWNWSDFFRCFHIFLKWDTIITREFLQITVSSLDLIRWLNNLELDHVIISLIMIALMNETV